METKVVGGRDTWWKVLEGAWVMGMRGSEFRCCTECNNQGLLEGTWRVRGGVKVVNFSWGWGS